MLFDFMTSLKLFKNLVMRPNQTPNDLLEKIIEDKEKYILSGKEASYLSYEETIRQEKVVELLKLQNKDIDTLDKDEAYKICKKYFDNSVKQLKKKAEEAKQMLSNLFNFCETVYTEEQEILIVVTELTTNYFSAQFITKYGCDEYFKHNKELLFYERHQEITQELNDLQMDNI